MTCHFFVFRKSKFIAFNSNFYNISISITGLRNLENSKWLSHTILSLTLKIFRAISCGGQNHMEGKITKI